MIILTQLWVSTPWRPFILTVLRDRANVCLEVDIVLSVQEACDSSGGHWIKKMDIAIKILPKYLSLLVPGAKLKWEHSDHWSSFSVDQEQGQLFRNGISSNLVQFVLVWLSSIYKRPLKHNDFLITCIIIQGREGTSDFLLHEEKLRLRGRRSPHSRSHS